MKPSHLKNLSANTIQLVINQVFGLAIFYILSSWLDKQSFGQLNWVLAILFTAFNILACGIDQLVIKKIAQGDDVAIVTGLFVNHVLFSGFIFYIAIGVVWWVMPHSPIIFQVLMLVGAGKLMIYFATPFKQLASGQERFGVLAKMSAVSNVVRGVALIVLAFFQQVTLITAVFVFLAGDGLEFAVTVYLFYKYLRVPLSFSFQPKPYFALLKEALPQIGVVLFTSALARFDWIFIGLFLSAVKLAEYSFAYKAFEISTLPLLAVAPLLLPRFVSVIKERGIFPTHLFSILKLELVFSVLIGLVFYLSWSPLVDWFTHGKYGAVNSSVILVLAVCMPLMYFNNFLWSIGFAQGKLRLIFKVFAVTFLVNVIGDVVLIPLLGNAGAAIAYLAAMLVQAILYMLTIEKQAALQVGVNLVICSICAIISGFIAIHFLSGDITVILFAAVLYLVFTILFRQINLKKLNFLKPAIGQ
ncbi:oligosaccharide flippase family protein [Mucilaginibacter jinjuensis]|uniref:Oligosaccharide flippase family protein n=1 Tax=Mucilaginibacter jinjuensis TaxID=1176721 RepID=A0ABY7TDY5_9SPHI|nr:oligosaccharide flippase family protein [Mucilaginibacter jinjuensis]WCT14583.1 oligosaccharide flippase family protein [Mucilaginibacter jinjuensis]